MYITDIRLRHNHVQSTLLNPSSLSPSSSQLSAYEINTLQLATDVQYSYSIRAKSTRRRGSSIECTPCPFVCPCPPVFRLPLLSFGFFPHSRTTHHSRGLGIQAGIMRRACSNAAAELADLQSLQGGGWLREALVVLRLFRSAPSHPWRRTRAKTMRCGGAD